MADPEAVVRDVDVIHRMKNHLAIILGFCELLLEDLPLDDGRRADIMEIQKAADAARSDMPELSRRLS
jgi:hypothetical protein